MVDSCLNTLLSHDILDVTKASETDSDMMAENDLVELRKLYDSIVEQQVSVSELVDSVSFHKLE